MSQSVLGSVTLGYQPIWNQARQNCGVRLLVDTDNPGAVDGSHLLAAITELRPALGFLWVLGVRAPALLHNLLEHAPAHNFQIEIEADWMADNMLAGRVRKAQQRGLSLVWRGQPGEAPTPEMAPWFAQTLRSLSPHEALGALRVALRQQQDAETATVRARSSPVHAGCLYEGLASQALVEHALDQQRVAGVVGWPMEEVLFGYRFRQMQPARQVLTRLIAAIDADESVEKLEHAMAADPLLCYRFLRLVNSAALSMPHEIGSLHQGLMTVGLTRLRNWLLEMLPHASSDSNLDPVRSAMVLRGRIMEHLAEAGVEEALRREVFQCGIFSQVDLLLGESLGSAIHRLPLPGRVASAIVGQTGPYAAWLEVAVALESGNTRMIRDVCRAHGVEVEAVNRALLRTLAAV
jgi:hypothetical protein